MAKRINVHNFQQALWEYVLEHSDILPSGTLFVKFHTKSKSQLEGHIISRINGYHRGDPNKREKEMLEKQKEFNDYKLEKQNRYAKLKIRQNKRRKLQKIYKAVQQWWLGMRLWNDKSFK